MIDPEVLLAGYATGIFPMADKDGSISWYSPDPRAIIPLDRYNIPRSTRQLQKSGRFRIQIDTCYTSVMRGCASRDETWISGGIIESYVNLFRLGYAHSVESFDEEGLAGGLYGVALGSAFFGESMFSFRSGASKVALAFLLEHMRQKGFTLLDVQYMTPHLSMFGAVEIPRDEYIAQLNEATRKITSFV